jgi:hypothetical protein
MKINLNMRQQENGRFECVQPVNKQWAMGSRQWATRRAVASLRRCEKPLNF